MPKHVDYYEFLQISPNADHETIHRVYHFLATRFHPDNPKSGNAEKFTVLKNAYDVLSDPTRRAKYDMAREKEVPHFVPLSSSIDFMDQMEGELNRRLALLAVLYFRRRTNPWSPEVALAEVEKRMGFPRDYLDFTTWYLERKGYITRADNSDFTLTAQGVDFVETKRSEIPVLNKLLTANAGSTSNGQHGAGWLEGGDDYLLPAEAPLVDRRASRRDRRAGHFDRRTGASDRRPNPVERRFHDEERREGTRDRRTNSDDEPDPKIVN
ncbi:MAG TPA: J domain-containing protein [Terracidiphilus sp.]|nr:J domain-containing protein [Terracidiphilus sp.]